MSHTGRYACTTRCGGLFLKITRIWFCSVYPHIATTIARPRLSTMRHLYLSLCVALASPVWAAQPPTAPMLRIEADMHTAMIHRIDVDAKGQYVVTGSADKTTRVWQRSTGQLLAVLRHPIGSDADEGQVFATAISPDGALVAVAGWTGHAWEQKFSIYIFNRSSGQLLRRLTGLENVIFDLAFSPNGQLLAATLYGRNGIRVFDPYSGAVLGDDRDYAADSYGVAWQNNQQLASTSFDGKIRLYQWADQRRDQGLRNGLQKIAEYAAGGQPYGISYAADSQRWWVGFNDSARLLSLDAQLRNPQALPVAGMNKSLSSVLWHRQQLWAGGKAYDQNGKHFIRRYSNDLGNGLSTAQDLPAANNTIMDLAAANTGVLFASGEPTWGELGNNGKISFLKSSPIATFRTTSANNESESVIKTDDHLKRLQFYHSYLKNDPAEFDLSTRRLSSGHSSTANVAQTNATGWQVSNWRNQFNPSINGKALALQQYESALSLSLDPGRNAAYLGTSWHIHRFDAQGQPQWRVAMPADVWGINRSADGQLLVAALADGTLRWYRASDGQELLALFVHADKQRWVLWTPSGYYDASTGAADLIGWHVNRGADQAADFYPASRFREQFNRPDIIDQILTTRDEAEAVKQANVARGSKVTTPVNVAQVLPPVVDLISASEVRSDQNSIEVLVQPRSSADAPVTDVRVRVDGQAVSTARAFSRTDTQGRRVLTVPIPSQDSTVQVFAENKHGTSSPATVRVTWTGQTAQAKPEQSSGSSGEAWRKPKLYVLAVGVSQYQDSSMNLAFAAKDAQDFVKAISQQKDMLYRDIEVKLLTNQQANRDSVVEGLEWLQSQVTQHDVGMVFLAGHGVNDASNKYYFLTNNANPDRLRSSAVSMDDIKDTVSNLAGKALFFIDSCHSGNALGTGRRSAVADAQARLVNELSSAENGVLVFSASTGRQFSLENPAWGNGAFTKALIEGIGGKADLNRSGKITHKMLDFYISDRVKQLTNGQQTPVTVSPSGVPDYPVALVR